MPDDIWEHYSIGEGKIGIFKNGKHQKTVGTSQEAIEWLEKKHTIRPKEMDEALKRAIERMD